MVYSYCKYNKNFSYRLLRKYNGNNNRICPMCSDSCDKETFVSFFSVNKNNLVIKND